MDVPAERLWTLAEANQALPQVARLVDEATTILGELRDIQANLRDLRIIHGDAVISPANPGYPEFAALMQAHNEQRERFATAVGHLAGLGVELKDVEQGLVDFRGMLGSRPAYLCWRRGEAAVTHWHELDAGFSGRKPLPQV